jgi:hypothetical protein
MNYYILKIKFILHVFKLLINLFIKLFYFLSFLICWGWGLGIGDWGLGIGPNPQSPIPNPQSPIPNPQ